MSTVSGMLVLELSSGCLIAEITLGVKVMAEGEGVEVFVYTKNGRLWSGKIVRGSMETKAKSYSHRSGGA